MTEGILVLTRWEWFKLQRRWMPWILLGILLVFSQLSVWGGFIAYNSLQSSEIFVSFPVGTDASGQGSQFRTVSCNDILADPSVSIPEGISPEVVASLRARCQQRVERLPGQLWRQYDQFTLPGSFSNAFGIAQTIGMILFAILTASVIGSDYGLGTLRCILVRGTGRLPYLAGKCLVLIAAAAGTLLAIGVITAISSLIAAGIADSPPGAAVEGSSWMDAGAALGKTWVSFIPYMAFTGTVTLLTRSAAAGMAIGLGYYFAEGILIALLTAFFEGFELVSDYLLIRNINAFVGGGFTFGLGGGGEIGLVEASAVLAVYTVALAGIAIRLFQRRDVTGASGG